MQGFRLFNSSIDIVLTFQLGHDITILKMAIFYKVDCIKIEIIHSQPPAWFDYIPHLYDYISLMKPKRKKVFMLTFGLLNSSELKYPAS